MSDDKLERVLKAYMHIRDTRSKNKREFEEEDKSLKSKLSRLEVELLKMMNSSGSDQLKVSGTGMAIKGKKTFVRANDWDAIWGYIEKHGHLDLLQRRLATRAVQEHVDTHDGELPPGISFDHEIVVTVRKS